MVNYYNIYTRGLLGDGLVAEDKSCENRMGVSFLDGILVFAPMLILFIIYYKVFRIASDIKEIKEMLKSNLFR